MNTYIYMIVHFNAQNLSMRRRVHKISRKSLQKCAQARKNNTRTGKFEVNCDATVHIHNTHAYIHICMCTYVHTYTHACKHAYYACVYKGTHTHTLTHVQTYMHTHRLNWSKKQTSVRLRVAKSMEDESGTKRLARLWKVAIRMFPLVPDAKVDVACDGGDDRADPRTNLKPREVLVRYSSAKLKLATGPFAFRMSPRSSEEPKRGTECVSSPVIAM